MRENSQCVSKEILTKEAGNAKRAWRPAHKKRRNLDESKEKGKNHPEKSNPAPHARVTLQIQSWKIDQDLGTRKLFELTNLERCKYLCQESSSVAEKEDKA